MNNAVFGKTMENVRQRSKVKIVSGHDVKKLESLIAKPYFKSFYIFKGSQLVTMRMGESTVRLNKPIYLGQTNLTCPKIT